MSQSHSSRKTLALLINQHGAEPFLSEVTCKVKLMDCHLAHEREMELLVTAVKQQIPSEMRRLNNMHHAILLPKLTRWLSREALLEEKEARWAIESWAMALGLIPFEEGELYPSSEEPTKQPCKTRLEGHRGCIGAIAFSPDSEKLASAGWDGSVRLWSIAIPGESKILVASRHSAKQSSAPRIGPMFLSVMFNTNGEFVAAGDSDGEIHFWDAGNGNEIQTLLGQLRSIHGLAFSSRKNLMASGSYDHTVSLWSLEELLAPLWNVELDYPVECVAFHPDGETLMASTKGCDIHVISCKSGEVIYRLTGHEGTIRNLSFSSDGSVLASASCDGSVRIWDVISGSVNHVFTMPQRNGEEKRRKVSPECVAVSPDMKFVATGDDGGKIWIWSFEAGEIWCSLESHASDVTDLKFSPDGKWLASSSADSSICLWEMAGIKKT